MSSPAPLPEKAPRPLRDGLRLLGKALSVALVCALAVLAIIMLVPEGNDYARATLRKHERLASVEGPKIVLVGGSNLAFGIDSRLIESRTGRPVVNMGMNGYFGVRYMLEEVRPSLRAGDTVVIALEYDSFFKPVDGTASNLMLIAKANPAALSYLTWRQRLDLLGAAPYVAQEKILRLLRGAVFGVRDVVEAEDDTAAAATEDELSARIETAGGFNAEGDLISHLGVTWRYEREQGIDPSTPVDPQVIGLLRAFERDMAARGVRVMVSYTPLLRDFYQRHQSGIDHIHTLVTDAALPAPSSPSTYVYDESRFFDTVYHLDADGRALRSEQLATDINAFLSPARQRTGAVQLTQTGASAHD